MFEAVCDCCGERKELHHYMMRIEKIENPSISMSWDMREAEVIPPEKKKRADYQISSVSALLR